MPFFPKNSLEEDWDEIDGNGVVENADEFFAKKRKIFETFSKLANPIIFEHSKKMPNLFFYGEMGSGKSTTANELMTLLDPNKKPKKFKSG